MRRETLRPPLQAHFVCRKVDLSISPVGSSKSEKEHEPGLKTQNSQLTSDQTAKASRSVANN